MCKLKPRSHKISSTATIVQSISISSFYPSCFASFTFGGAGLSDLPHSRQNRLARGVIKPQNGHTLCDWNSSDLGFNIANNFGKNAKTDFIDFTFVAMMTGSGC